jgi:hypothetical protein
MGTKTKAERRMKTSGSKEMTILLQRLYLTGARSSIKNRSHGSVSIVAMIREWQYKKDSPVTIFSTLPDNGIV